MSPLPEQKSTLDLAKMLLHSAQSGDWEACSRLLREREQSLYLVSRTDRLKILELDTQTLSLFEAERVGVGTALLRLSCGSRLLDRYASQETRSKWQSMA